MSVSQGMRNRATLRSFGIALLLFPSIPNVADGQPRSRGGLLTISARVNGEAELFLVDTGAARSAVDQAFARRLGFKTTGSAGIRKNFSIEDVPIVTVSSVEFANRVFPDVALLEINLQPVSQAMSVTVAGILGTDLLSNAYVKLRYSSGTAEVVAGPDSDALPVKVKKVDDVFVVPVRLGSSIVEMLLDTGANLTAVSYDTWTQLSFTVTPGLLVEGIRSAGEVVESALGCARTIGLGEVVLNNQPIQVVRETQSGNFADTKFAGLLGGDALEHFDVTLDLAQSRIYLKPDPTYHPDSYAFVTIGIQFVRTTTGTFAVAAVWTPSPAHEAGLVVGDQIVSINGQKSADLDQDTFALLLHQPAGTLLTLELARPEGIVVVRTKTRRLACMSE